MWQKRWMWIVWPAFLVAGLLEVLVFALVDPYELNLQWLHAETSRTAVYTVAFFIFWLLLIVAGYLMALLALPVAELNHKTLQREA